LINSKVSTSGMFLPTRVRTAAVVQQQSLKFKSILKHLQVCQPWFCEVHWGGGNKKTPNHSTSLTPPLSHVVPYMQKQNLMPAFCLISFPPYLRRWLSSQGKKWCSSCNRGLEGLHSENIFCCFPTYS